eukprot:214729-Prorocentrum_minimum.AAC.2
MHCQGTPAKASTITLQLYPLTHSNQVWDGGRKMAELREEKAEALSAIKRANAEVKEAEEANERLREAGDWPGPRSTRTTTEFANVIGQKHHEMDAVGNGSIRTTEYANVIGQDGSLSESTQGSTRASTNTAHYQHCAAHGSRASDANL